MCTHFANRPSQPTEKKEEQSKFKSSCSAYENDPFALNTPFNMEYLEYIQTSY